LINYEVGIRPVWFEHTLTLDSAIFFFIDWSDIQLRLTRPDGYYYVANAGAAHNKDEVIVTASRRAEPLSEVADSITAFTGGNLESLGAQNLEDYIGRAPGVQFQGSIPGRSNVNIRGVGTGSVTECSVLVGRGGGSGCRGGCGRRDAAR
jgi:hypothetical protein